ncbi:MAG: hypothetical protein QXF52_10000 [Thermoproteota archaeon]
MTEQDLVGKMEEFMNLLDQVKMYRKALSCIPNLVIALLSVSCISFLILILIKVSVITSGRFSIISGFSSAYGSSFSPQIILLLFLLPVLWSIVIGLIVIERKVKKIKRGERVPRLKEDVSIAIKLLIEADWESIFSDILMMKWWLVIKMFNWIFLGYLIILPIFSILLCLFYPLFFARYGMIGLGALILTTPVVLFINRKNIGEFYRNIKSIDLLIIDLRWLYNELKGARLEA